MPSDKTPVSTPHFPLGKLELPGQRSQAGAWERAERADESFDVFLSSLPAN
jgi:hypothetical protein